MRYSLIVVALALVGCGSEDTGGNRIVLRTVAVAEPKITTTFTTGFGWDVTLTKATVAIGGLYYFDSPPPTALRSRSLGERWSGLFIGTAWAHPGHYQAGSAVGQVAFGSPIALDLFGPMPITLPEGEGVTGTYRSARVLLPSTDRHVGIAEGRATKHDGSSPAPIFFRLVADYADITGSIKNGAIDGCVLDETNVTDSGTVTLEVKPSVWLNLVDFSKIAPGSAEQPTEARDSGFSQGLTQLSAYAFRYAK